MDYININPNDIIDINEEEDLNVDKYDDYPKFIDESGSVIDDQSDLQ